MACPPQELLSLPKSLSGNVAQRGILCVHAGIVARSRRDALSPDFIFSSFDLIRLASLAVRFHSSLAAENLFLRKQLALFQERKVKPRRANDATRWSMATLGRMFPWRNALVNVKPDTLIRW